MSRNLKRCRCCGVALSTKNWREYRKANHDQICKNCDVIEQRKYRTRKRAAAETDPVEAAGAA